MSHDTLAKTNYKKFTEIAPHFAQELQTAKATPAANTLLRLEPGLNLHYLQELEGNEHLIGLAEIRMKDGEIMMEQTFILSVNTKEKTLEVIQTISPRVSFPAYLQHEDGTRTPAPMHKYVNEYLEMKLDKYIERCEQITFLEPYTPEELEEQTPEEPNDPLDEIAKLRRSTHDKSNDRDIN